MREEWKQIEVPEELDQIIDTNLALLKAGQRKKTIQSRVRRGLAVAAVFACSTIFYMKNPASAAKLPIIGHIFERIQDSVSFQGDYSGIAKPLNDVSATDNSEPEAAATSAYTQTAEGITITLSEIYCNDQAIYLTMQMKSEKPFPKIMGHWQFLTAELYSYNQALQGGSPVLEGTLLDAYTYAGMLRLDLNDTTTDNSELLRTIEAAEKAGKEIDYSTDNQLFKSQLYKEQVKQVAVPDAFTLDLTLEELLSTPEEDASEFLSDKEVSSFDEEEQLIRIKGNWHFTLDVQKDLSDTQVVDLRDRVKDGIGFEKVVKDRFEITMYDTYPDPDMSYDYFPVMLDADGRLMDLADTGSCNTVPINDRDVSRVDLFLFDYLLWMDELKGDYWTQENAVTEDGRAYRDLLLEKCAYHTEVVFEEH